MGDVEQVLCPLIGPSTKIHESLVPFLNRGRVYERCGGAVMVRHERTTLTVPCLSMHVDEKTPFCFHCCELWKFSDEDGVYKLTDSMTNAMAKYEAGVNNKFYLLSSMENADRVHSETTADIKEKFDGSGGELSSSCPDYSFRELIFYLCNL